MRHRPRLSAGWALALAGTLACANGDGGGSPAVRGDAGPGTGSTGVGRRNAAGNGPVDAGTRTGGSQAGAGNRGQDAGVPLAGAGPGGGQAGAPAAGTGGGGIAGGPPIAFPPADAAPPVVQGSDAALAPDEAETSGCEIVTCSGLKLGCCKMWQPYASDSPANGQLSIYGIIDGFVRTSKRVGAVYHFTDPQQSGTLSVQMPAPQTIVSAAVHATAVGGSIEPVFASIETQGGTSGCTYNVDAGGALIMGSPRLCWGESPFIPRQLSVRVKSKAAGEATLTVTGVSLTGN